MYAKISIGWDYAIEVPVADMSKVIETLGKYPRVVREYDGHEGYWYLAEKQVVPVVEITQSKADQVKREQVVKQEQPVVSE
jgi:hypothetical protein